MSECKEKIDDNAEMPNLCRRGRKSPHNSFSTSRNDLNSSINLNSSPFKSPIKNLLNSINLFDETQRNINKTRENISSLRYIRDLFFSRRQVETNSTTTTSSVTTTTTTSTASLDQNINIRPIFATIGGNTNGSSSRMFTQNLNSDLDEGTTSSSRMVTRSQTRPQASTSNTSTNNNISRQYTVASTYMEIDENSRSQREQQNRRDQQPSSQIRDNKRKSRWFSCSYLMLFLAFLIPFLIYGLNRLDENENFLEKINKEYIKEYFDLNVNQETFDTINYYAYASKDGLSYFFTVYIPDKFSLDSILNKTYSMTKKATDYLYDFKPSTIGGHDITHNMLNLNKEDLLRDLSAIKDKIIKESMHMFQNVKSTDMELLRKDLDQKFNFTLSTMSNKIADQLLQFEKTKNSYESELNKIRQVLSELENRYTSLLNSVQEKVSKLDSDILNHQTTTQATNIVEQAEESLRQTFSNENISFKKIEEYINRTFYLYNADKTGMTDFASESIGGSILFSKCTEQYTDNARWFTLFDVPISRIVVSPRVVIQVKNHEISYSL